MPRLVAATLILIYSIMLSIDDYNQFYVRYNKQLVRFANAYLHDEHLAEDCAIEALMKLWERRSDINATDDSLIAWTLTVVRNRCINILKRRRTVAADLSDEAWTVNEHIRSLEAFDPYGVSFFEMQQIIRDTLERMPQRTRDIFMAYMEGNLTQEQLAGQFNISSRGVEYHITKARNLLRQALGDYAPLAVFIMRYFVS